MYCGYNISIQCKCLARPQPCPVRNSERSFSYAVFGRTSLSNRNIVLAILLLAGDVHPNTVPINRETIYPCGYCQQHVGQGCQLSRIWRDSHAFDLLLTQLTNLLAHF